jgi:hypothetical protein
MQSNRVGMHLAEKDLAELGKTFSQYLLKLARLVNTTSIC